MCMCTYTNRVTVTASTAQDPRPGGGRYRASRVWAILDLLLTSGTLREAIEHTRIVTGLIPSPNGKCATQTA
jgi:hypothetical protein